MSYQGPNVKVRQNFETTPPAVSIESLPTALVGTAYEVHKDEVLLSYDGIDANGTSTSAPWVVDGSNKVIYAESQGEKIYNFYPPAFKVIDSENGGTFDVDAPGTVSSSGVLVNHFDTFTLETVADSTKAYIPYCHATGTISISLTSKKVECSDGRFIDTKLVSGLRVVDDSANVIGYVDYVESNTVLYLKSNSSQATAADLYFGAAVEDGAAITSKACYIYDPDTNFTRLGVKRGDVVKAITSSGIADAIAAASIVAIVSDNLIEIFSGAAQSGNYASAVEEKPVTIGKVYSSTGYVVSSTVMVTDYDIERFIGFTEKYDISSSAGAAVTCEISGTTLTLSAAPYDNGGSVDGDAYSLQIGDTVVVNSIAYSIILATSATEYTLDASGTETAGSAIKIFKSSDATNQIVNDLSADYRAVMVANNGVVFKSSDNDLIGTAGIFGVASVYNELAFMIQVAMGVNGGRVLYAIGVDPTDNITTAYGDALEALKFFDVYSHALGTTEAGVNTLLPSYVDEQSDPYEAHERIAVQAYAESDVYLLGSGAGTIATGTITSSGVNLVTIGLGIGDVVGFVDTDGSSHEGTVVSTPSATGVVIDYVTASDATTFYYYAGVKSKQANRIKALGVGNRRITTIWPGSFLANTTAAGDVPAMSAVELPAYYLSALVAGMDGGQKVSQSLTKLVTGVPGLSNIQLGTNSYFRKADLDNIGSGGIDILIQDNPISNTIFSRHDLTTNMDAVELRERSITKQGDQSAKTIRTALDPYTGKYNIDDNLLKFLNQVASIAGKTLIKDGVVKGVEVISVKRDPDIADKINVVITITVFVAGNYYDVDLNIVSK